MRIILSVGAAAALVVALAGCGKKDDKQAGDQGAKTPAAGEASSSSGGGGKASSGGGGKPSQACDRREKEQLCATWSGSATADWVKENCDAMGGVVIASCPTDGAVGHCTREAGGSMETVTWMYGPAYTADTARAMCGDPGSQFTP